METILLKDIPPRENSDQLRKKLHLEENEEMLERFDILMKEAQKIAKPKAVYVEANVETIDGFDVTIGGVQFHGSLLSSTLKEGQRVFLYISTCGTEIEEWSEQFTEHIDRYLTDQIKEEEMAAARDYLKATIKEKYGLDKFFTMQPGSRPEWAISEQKPLFELIGNAEDLIGATVTKSFLLMPVKTSSGLIYEKNI